MGDGLARIIEVFDGKLADLSVGALMGVIKSAIGESAFQQIFYIIASVIDEYSFWTLLAATGIGKSVVISISSDAPFLRIPLVFRS